MKSIIKNAISLLPKYMSEVIINLISNNRLKIEFVSEKTLLKEYTENFEEVYGQAVYSYIDDNYKVLISKDITINLKLLYLTICHEFVHIWQYETKYNWVIEMDSEKYPYDEDPVEKEAIRKSRRYIQKGKYLWK